MIRHISMSIEWLESKFNILSYQVNNKYCKDAFGMTFWKVKKHLKQYKEKWWKFIPSSSCPNINELWACWCWKIED